MNAQAKYRNYVRQQIREAREQGDILLALRLSEVLRLMILGY